MRPFHLAPWLLLGFIAAIAGCASDGVEVSTTFDPLATFPAQATYSWDDRNSTEPKDERMVALEMGAITKEASEEALAKHGYRAVTGEVPNFLLSYHLVTNTWFGADNSRALGSVSLLFVDAASGRRVWLGFGQSEVYVGLTRAERKQRMVMALEKMLVNFPPNQRGK